MKDSVYADMENSEKQVADYLRRARMYEGLEVP